MCASCGFRRRPVTGPRPGAATAPDRLRARFRRARCCKSVLPAYGLSAHDGARRARHPGRRRCPAATPIVRDLEEVWAAAEQLAGRPVDPLDPALHRRTGGLSRSGGAPTACRDGRMRLTVLGGFLGSGKTTWLRHQLHAGRCCATRSVLVNEAAETPVDDVLLAALLARSRCSPAAAPAAPPRADLSRCCAESATSGSRQARRRARSTSIVLETSGARRSRPDRRRHPCRPGAGRTTSWSARSSSPSTPLHALAQLAQRAARPAPGRDRRPADRHQDRCSGRRRACQACCATLQSAQPGRADLGAVRGSTGAAARSSADAEPAAPARSSARRARPCRSSRRARLDDDVDWTAFSVWLSALLHARGDDVLRVKGVVRTPAGRLLLQSVRKVVQSPEILPEQPMDRAARGQHASSSSAAAIAAAIPVARWHFVAAGVRCARI